MSVAKFRFEEAMNPHVSAEDAARQVGSKNPSVLKIIVHESARQC